jgi:hypothetical protein
MKGLILGSDLLEYNNSVKLLEINTNTTIFNSAAPLLDYTPFFQMLVNNNITELHFIWNEDEAFIKDTDSFDFEFEEMLKVKCIESNIQYFNYKVPKNSVSVPYVEDANNKFILRQAFDTTALIDETYCADKFEFFNLMKDSEYIPKTYINNNTTDLSFDIFDTTINYSGGQPNIVKKSRYPEYDFNLYPAVSKLTNTTELNELKTSVDNTNFLLQEFIYDDSNVVDNRWNIIRSIDIIYGGELDVINLGSYRTSTYVDINAWGDEYETNGTQLTKKSRYKWVNKTQNISNGDGFNYHANSDSLILGADGNLISLNDLHVGSAITGIDWTNSEGLSPSGDLEILKNPPRRYVSTLNDMNSTISTAETDVINIFSNSLSSLFIKITLEDGTYWNELKDTPFFIQTEGNDLFHFDRLNTCLVGDKIATYNKTTKEISTKTITGLDIVFDEIVGYNIDVEPCDIFLVNINTPDLFVVQHNFDCGYCGWFSCDSYGCNYHCPGCPGGPRGFK